jgi:hypothetical protein
MGAVGIRQRKRAQRLRLPALHVASHRFAVAAELASGGALTQASPARPRPTPFSNNCFMYCGSKAWWAAAEKSAGIDRRRNSAPSRCAMS